MFRKLALLGGIALALSIPAFAANAPQYKDSSGQNRDAVGVVIVDDNGVTANGGSHIGEVGNNQSTITVAQTVTAASAYTANNAVGGLITFANAARIAAGSGLIQSIVVNSKSAQTTQMDMIVFNANPTGSTCTDKTALAVVAADFDKVLGVAHITDWTAVGTPSLGQAQNLAMPFALASGTTIWGCLVTRSTPTFTATTDISVSFRVIRN